MLSLIVALLALQAAASVERTNCAQLQPAQLDLQPLGRGPLRLASIHCHQSPGSGGGGVRPLMSRDGEQIATVSRYDPEGQISFFPLRAGARMTSFDTGVGGFMSFGATSTMAPVSWSADSKFVWTARQQRMGPTGGWALTPLAPLRVYPDGRTEELPRLTHLAGSLDGFLWAGGKGLALAQFGTHGQFYRPVRPNPSPALAIVDASRGKVLEALPLAQFIALAGREVSATSYAAVRRAFAVQRPDGRVRALLSVHDKLILWDQGRGLRLLPGAPSAEATATAAFDGRRLLVMRPEGSMIMSCGPPRHGPCPPRDPQPGTWAALYDVEAGRVLWALRRTFDARDSFDTPQISPDGRHALVGLEPQPSGGRPLALVSLGEGRVLQTLPASSYDDAHGFTRGGAAVWVQGGQVTAIYDVD